MEAWLYFIGSDKPEDIRRVIQKFPKFEEMYQEISIFRYDPEEAVQMFSDALRKLDENTVNYMIEELRAEIEEKNSELKVRDNLIEELQKQILELKKESVS